MKILKRVAWSQKFTCKGCKSELEAEPADVIFGRFGTYDDFEDTWYVKCTECETTHELKPADVPQNVKNEARRSYEESVKVHR